MRTPWGQFLEEERISRATGNRERNDGRLRVVHVRGRVFVDDEDREEWRRSAPKTTGRAGARTIQTVAHSFEALARAIAAGQIDRNAAAAALSEAAQKAGLELTA
jgi:hypothetical protein